MARCFIGVESSPDETTGQFPAKDTTLIYERSMRVVDASPHADAVWVEDRYAVRDPMIDKKVREYNFQAQVDPWTGVHLRPEYHNEVWVFPHWVEKKTYALRNNYLKGTPLSLQREETIEGLSTYVFAYNGRAEYTESYSGTAGYADMKVEPGQEVRCGDDQFFF